MGEPKNLALAYVLCALFASVGAHRLYLQDWAKACCARPVHWLIALWLASNFWLFVYGGNYVIVGGHWKNCTKFSWTGDDSGVIAGGCWGLQTPTYQFWWVLHYINMAGFLIPYFVELCRLPWVVAATNKALDGPAPFEQEKLKQ